MTRWTITAIDRLCGGCGKHLPQRAPVLEITIGRIGVYRCQRVKYRGECCAGPAPPPVEGPIVTVEKSAPIDMTRIGLLTLAWGAPPERKLVAAGRKPDEEG